VQRPRCWKRSYGARSVTGMVAPVSSASDVGRPTGRCPRRKSARSRLSKSRRTACAAANFATWVAGAKTHRTPAPDVYRLLQDGVGSRGFAVANSSGQTTTFRPSCHWMKRRSLAHRGSRAVAQPVSAVVRRGSGEARRAHKAAAVGAIGRALGGPGMAKQQDRWKARQEAREQLKGEAHLSASLTMRR
jgi:hypothetical protein